jgi:2'-5' RNA ligase
VPYDPIKHKKKRLYEIQSLQDSASVYKPTEIDEGVASKIPWYFVVLEGDTFSKEDNHDSAMIAFMLPIQASAALVEDEANFPKGSSALPMDEMHITLYYLGKTEELHDKNYYPYKVERILEKFVKDQRPFDITVTGVGKFEGVSDGKQDVYYAKVDNPDLQKFRAAMIEALKEGGCYYGEDYPTYNPHVTLAYVPAGSVGKVTVPNISFTVDKIHYVWGADMATFPFGGPADYARNDKIFKTVVKLKGGAGSGHHGHEGRPGKRGGSLPGSGSFAIRSLKESLAGGNVTREALEEFATIPVEDDNYYYFTHATRDVRYIDDMLENGIKPGGGGKIFASRGFVRDLRQGYVIFRVSKDEPNFEEGIDVVELGVTYPEFRFRNAIPPSDIVRVVKPIPLIGKNYGVNEDTVVKFALQHQGGHPDMNDLPDLYRKLFFIDENFSKEDNHDSAMIAFMLPIQASAALVEDEANFPFGGPADYARNDKIFKTVVKLKGGAGSGHHGHQGRPGKVGGSTPGTYTLYNELSDEEIATLEADMLKAIYAWDVPGSVPNDLFGKHHSAVGKYKGQTYKTINDSLRKNGKVTRTVKLIDDVIEGETSGYIYARKDGETIYLTKAQRNMITYRALGDSKAIRNMKFEVGQVFQDKAYSSTSFRLDGAQSVSNIHTLMRINIPKGSNGLFVEPFFGGATGEHEWLLPRDSQFRILGITSVDGIQTIDVELLP